MTPINDIPYIAKIEAGKLTSELRDFVFPSFLDNLAAIIRLRSQQKAIAFEYQALSQLPTVVRGDETRLRQLLLNLLGNAVKFTYRGKVTFKVGYAITSPLAVTQEQNLIRFQIEDTGRGIPRDRFKDIFLPFYQLNPHQQSQEGTGLGLTISHSLAEQMGSQIEIESTVDKGSIFWFDLALLIDDVSETVVPQDANLDLVGYQERLRKILVMDDLDSNREILVNLLTSLKFELIEARAGEEAIALTQKHQPDLVSLDLVLPGMDGWDVTQRLRQKLQHKMPVIK